MEQKRREIRRVKPIVEAILRNDPDTRNSDSLLYVRVCQRIDEKLSTRPFFYVMAHSKDFGLPPFETVSRCRRKLQEKDDSLQAVEEVQKARQDNQEAFLELAGGNGNA